MDKRIDRTGAHLVAGDGDRRENVTVDTSAVGRRFRMGHDETIPGERSFISLPQRQRTGVRSLSLLLRLWLSLWVSISGALGADRVEAADAASAWRLVSVPGPQDLSGTAWYRAWVKVPDSYFTKHERNLFEESVGVYIRVFRGAHEVWMNGKRIGSGGSFPPNYRDGKESLYRHKVPVGTLSKGAWNEIAIRVHHPDGAQPAGFVGEAPFIMDYFLECLFDGTWEFRTGGDYVPGGPRTDRPSVAAFDSFHESNRVLGRAEQVHGPRLPAEESAARMRPGADFRAELLLSEPLVAQPTHFSFDDRGRLWVAQYRQYPYPAGLTMLSRDKYYRAHYDKIPPAPPRHDKGADVISIHADSDGDGVYDQHKVFADGLNMANAVVTGHGGVWVMHTPYLLFYADRDADDVPDGEPEVRLAGFGLEDTHSVANGLAWGPDGWLYGAQGSTTSCRVTRPGLDPADAPGVYFEGCHVWRYHPETRAFEIFSEGGGNTFGLEFDAQGRLYSGHNGGGTRGWHFVQGGFYQMQGVDPGKFGPPRNPYAFGELPMMRTTNEAVRFTHFGAFAEGTALPAKYQGMLFSLDPLHNVILTSTRWSRGSTFDTFDGEPALRSDDETFRPLYLANAPDGSLFVSDMCEYYIAHGQHYQNQIDPTTGRIYRLRGKNAVLEDHIDLKGKSTDELIGLLSHANKWHRHTAVRLLGERRDPNAVPKLRLRVAQSDNGLAALGALWALYQITRFEGEEETIGKALAHPYAPVRMWGSRLLGDEFGVHRGLGVGSFGRSPEGTVPPKLYALLATQARTEADPEVLSQFASTSRRLNSAQAIDLVSAVMRHENVAGDPFLPQLCWWVFEAHLRNSSVESDDVARFFQEPGVWEMPVVFDYILPRIARRYGVEGKRADLLRCAELFRLAPSPRHAGPLMAGLEEAFRGRSMSGLPDELLEAIGRSGQAPLVFRVRQSDPTAVRDALARLQDSKVSTEDRVALIRALGETRNSNAVPALLAIVGDASSSALRKAAFGALSAYDDDTLGARVRELLSKLEGDALSAALIMLSSRPSWSARLLDAVKEEAVKVSSIPHEVVLRLRASKDDGLRERAVRILPEPAPVPAEFQNRIGEITSLLQQGPGNPYVGEALFTARCAACHKLFFKGGNVGPDLTPYQRDNLSTMLLSIVDPSAEVREGFQGYSVMTKDGRDLTGFIVDRDNQVVVLRGLDGENVTLRLSDITELQPMGRSLMPHGLLDDMNEQQLRDFFAYLRISQPITN